jgi:hypothetical protein
LPGCTEPALEGVVFYEGDLNWMQLTTLSQALDCRDLLSICHCHQSKAREHASAADVNSAGPALAAITSLLRTC